MLIEISHVNLGRWGLTGILNGLRTSMHLPWVNYLCLRSVAHTRLRNAGQEDARSLLVLARDRRVCMNTIECMVL